MMTFENDIWVVLERTDSEESMEISHAFRSQREAEEYARSVAMMEDVAVQVTNAYLNE